MRVIAALCLKPWMQSIMMIFGNATCESHLLLKRTRPVPLLLIKIRALSTLRVTAAFPVFVLASSLACRSMLGFAIDTGLPQCGPHLGATKLVAHNFSPLKLLQQDVHVGSVAQSQFAL